MYPKVQTITPFINTMLEYHKKNSAEDVSDEGAIDTFIVGLRHSDFVEEMGRIKPKTVVELMGMANKFADGEDTYHNKRSRSTEDDRSLRYSNKQRRFCNHGNYSSHSQVAARVCYLLMAPEKRLLACS
jgi:hypothetical protein